MSDDAKEQESPEEGAEAEPIELIYESNHA